MNTITIKDGKEKQLLSHHPWVFSGAIDEVNAPSASIVKVLTSDLSFLAWGWYDKDSHIPVHLLSWNEDEVIDDTWWINTVKKSVLRRKQFFTDANGDTNCFRIIFSEADMIPGITADVYGKMIRVIISARVAWDHKDLFAKALDDLLHPEVIVITTDKSYTHVEGLKETTLFFKNGEYFTPDGKLDNVYFKENDLIFEVAPGSGQKSGFYCDQRDNRQRIEKYCKGATVLDGCCYTGAFTMHALRAGAKSVDSFDSSDPALRQLLRNIHINQNSNKLPENSREKVTTKVCNIFQELRVIEKDYYDVMILDPPKLAMKKSQVETASRAYKDMNRLAMEKIKDGGIIATFSCSGGVDLALLRTILAWSSMDSKVEIQILETLTAPSDHPVRLSFPESEYLCGYIIKVIK
ncbi:MAG: class I SAM-dependent rRNA methyltransferase [Sphaerochaeta sp.]